MKTTWESTVEVQFTTCSRDVCFLGVSWVGSHLLNDTFVLGQPRPINPLNTFKIIWILDWDIENYWNISINPNDRICHFFYTLGWSPWRVLARRALRFSASGLRQAARQRHRVGGGAEADCADAGGWAAGAAGPIGFGKSTESNGWTADLWILQIPRWDFEWEIRLAGYGEVFPVDFPMNQGEIGPGRNKSRDFSRCQTFQQIFLWIFMIEPVRRGVNPSVICRKDDRTSCGIETAMEL